MKVVEFIGRIITEQGELSREDHAACRALINCLSDTEIEELVDKYELDWHLSRFVEEKRGIESQKTSRPIEHNKDWQEYFKILKQRTPGKVAEARKHLHAIFPFLKWNYQRQIIRFSICSELKVDRVWALEQLNDNWNLIEDTTRKQFDSWISDIEKIWNLYSDKESAFLLLKHLPYEMTAQYEQKLSDVVGYKQVALRLGTNATYVIDRTKLTDIDYLYVMAKLSRNITEEIAEQILTETIQMEINDCFCPVIRDNSSISLLSARNISLVVWCLGKLNHSQLIMDFYERNRLLQTSLEKDCSSIETTGDLHTYWKQLCSRVKDYFPLPPNDEEHINEEQKQIREQLIIKNPALASLIEKLQLE